MMPLKFHYFRVFVPMLLLGGCIPAEVEHSPRPAPSVRGAATRASPAIVGIGLENVIGANARALAAQFGTPDLDVREGVARKLQFSNAVCILDAYLYPRSERGEAVVTYIDARFPDGRTMDRASCVAALRAAYGEHR